MTSSATASNLSAPSNRGGRALSETIGEWASRNPRIRRVWVAGTRASGNCEETLPVALELQPVGDSEETMVMWIAHGEKWRRELQATTGRTVELQWLDPDVTSARLRFEQASALVYERAS